MIVTPNSIDVLPEPKLEFGYKQQLEDPRNGLFLFGPIMDNRTPAQIRVGVVGTPLGLAIYRKWVEAISKLVPAASVSSQHQFPFPGFEAAFRARWTSSPIVEIAVSPTEIANAIRQSDRHKAIYQTVGLFERPISTYAGREVPNPLLIEICRGDAELDSVLGDVLGLTKVNFNACIFADGLPVTLRFADAVGEILTAAPSTEGPPLPFRHYI